MKALKIFIKQEFVIKLILIVSIFSLTLFAFNNKDLVKIFRLEIALYPIGQIYLLMGKVFVSVNILGFLWYIVNFLKYKPILSVKDEELPFCSVVIPAYNEGIQVMNTIVSVSKSNYPKHKLQIISIDDGSMDDTWEWMNKAKRKCGREVVLIKMKKNSGKREALTEGFKNCVGEVIVTIDSDCLVTKDTLRNMVSPFVKDERVGAVAGNVRVLNSKEGLIPKMLDVAFTYSFDFIRAAQSSVNTVMCTPGALSGYRKSIVMNVLDQWRNQIFLGQVSKIGEDRAMTNLILKNGYSVLFQQNAVVLTNVPVHWVQLCKMFLRWARSNIRETIVMSGFVFNKFREQSKVGARINIVFHIFNMIKSEIMLSMTIMLFFWRPLEMFFVFWLGSAITLSFSFLFFTFKNKNSEGLWIYCYGLYWLVGLAWISTYALFTPQNSSWMTRDKISILPQLNPEPKVTFKH